MSFSLIALIGTDQENLFPFGDFSNPSLRVVAGVEGRLYFNGRAEGKHWYTRDTLLLDTHWRQYTTTTKLPKDIENFSVQFACSDRAVYHLNTYALFETPESADEIEAAGNRIVNGGAERGWYGVGCPINYLGRPFAE